MRYKRLDFNKIGKITRTPAGGVVLSGAVTRAGIFRYRTSDGKTIIEYRPSSEVFSPDSMASLNGATVTIDHPREMVSPKNYRSVTRGHVAERSSKRDGTHLVSDLAIDDAECIRRIDAGELVEISCGYECDVDETPGVVPDGEPDAGMRYDRVQRRIVYNHVALGESGWGRGGSSVSLRLDSRGNVCLNGTHNPNGQPRTRTMKFPKIEYIKGNKVRIDGVEYSLSTRSGRIQARAAADAALARIRDHIKSVRKDNDEPDEDDALNQLLSTLTEAIGTIHKMVARNAVEAENVPPPDAPIDDPAGDDEPMLDADDEPAPDKDNKDKVMDALVQERVAIVDKARRFDSNIVIENRSNADIMRDTLRAARVDGVDKLAEAELRGAFAVVRPHVTHPSLGALGEGSSPRNRTRSDSGNDGQTAQQKHKDHLANAWKPKRA